MFLFKRGDNGSVYKNIQAVYSSRTLPDRFRLFVDWLGALPEPAAV